MSDVGTDFPRRLVRLAPMIGPHVYVYGTPDRGAPYVQVFWGSGFLGHKGFFVGNTNFIANARFQCWAPGVYFDNNH